MSAKSGALVDLVLDTRYRALWTRPSREFGDDAYRREAARSLNAHAGHPLITDTDLTGLAREADIKPGTGDSDPHNSGLGARTKEGGH